MRHKQRGRKWEGALCASINSRRLDLALLILLLVRVEVSQRATFWMSGRQARSSPRADQLDLCGNTLQSMAASEK